MGFKIYQKTMKYTKIEKNGHKIGKIFHCKSLKNLPKLGFLCENMPSGNPDSEWK
jgi:hypothetical protein